jgi:hypothetical protein
MELNELINNDIFIGKSISLSKKSINLMLESLSKDEKPIIVTNCNMNDKPGVITITNKRLIFSSVVLFNYIKKEFDLKHITSLSYESSFMNKLTITSYSEKLIISAIKKEAGNKIIDKFNDMKD